MEMAKHMPHHFFGLVLALPIMATVTPVQAAEPYAVHGNTHIVIGITLDEAAVRAALPEGLVPAEGTTGGINIYRSEGGAGVAAYERGYIWADLAGLDSITGSQGRRILWAIDSVHSDSLKALGLDAAAGSTNLVEDGKSIEGVAALDGSPATTVAIGISEDDCQRSSGSVNYANDIAEVGLTVTQIGWAGDICSTTSVDVDFDPDDSKLQQFKPTSVDWAVLIRDLSFSSSPPFPMDTAAE